MKRKPERSTGPKQKAGKVSALAASRGKRRKKDSALEDAVRAGKNRDYRKAILILGEILSNPDAPAEAYLYLGRSFHATGDHARALACFNDYIRLKSESYEGYFFAGRACLSLTLPQRAVPFFRKAVELALPSLSRAHRGELQAFLGIAYLKSRHSGQAVETLQEAVEAAPENLKIYRAYINALFIRGIKLCRNEDYDLGRQMLRFVLENGGAQAVSSPLLRLELGRACRELGFRQEALDHYTEALKASPSDKSIRWYRASILMALGQAAEARKEIDLIRKAETKNSALLPPDEELPWNSEIVDLFMIRSLLGAGEWRQAAEACKAWLRRESKRNASSGIRPSPQDAAVHTMYAEALRKLRNYSASLNHLDRAGEIDDSAVQIAYEKLLVAWESENWKALRNAIKTAQRLGGDREFIARFSILLEGRTEEDDIPVIGRLQGAIRRWGPDPDIMYALAERYLRIGLIEEALDWFRKVFLVQPGHERAWLGQIAALEAQIIEGGDGHTISEGSDRRPPGLLAKGEYVLQRQSLDQTHRELREAYGEYLKRWPDNYTIRRERALYLVHTFEYQDAAADLETLLAWESRNPSLRRVLAYCYRKTGRYQEAAVFLKALLKENPRSLNLILEYSGCLERAGTPVYAAAVLESALPLLPAAAELPMALGLILSRQKKTEKAFDCFREAIARAPGDERPWRCMAALSRNIGDKAAAAKYEKQAEKASSSPKGKP
ncbi:MAG: tetratricopeptide repeat protein [Treponema sp.]|nr:tetratricopeptide repeat protein [Treponema sp.]